MTDLTFIDENGNPIWSRVASPAVGDVIIAAECIAEQISHALEEHHGKPTTLSVICAAIAKGLQPSATDAVHRRELEALRQRG